MPGFNKIALFNVLFGVLMIYSCSIQKSNDASLGLSEKNKKEITYITNFPSQHKFYLVSANAIKNQFKDSSVVLVVFGTGSYKLDFKSHIPLNYSERPVFFVFPSFNLGYNKKVLQYHKQKIGFIIDPFYYSSMVEEKINLFIKELSANNQTVSTKQHHIFILEKGNTLLLNKH
jgi:hypothetical protein